MVTDRYQATITMSVEMRDNIDAHRHPATSRSEWVREAINARLEAENRGGWEEYAPDSSEEENDSDSTDVGTHASR